MPHDCLVLDNAFRGVFSTGFVVSLVLPLFLFSVVINSPIRGSAEPVLIRSLFSSGACRPVLPSRATPQCSVRSVSRRQMHQRLSLRNRPEPVGPCLASGAAPTLKWPYRLLWPSYSRGWGGLSGNPPVQPGLPECSWLLHGSH